VQAPQAADLAIFVGATGCKNHNIRATGCVFDFYARWVQRPDDGKAEALRKAQIVSSREKSTGRNWIELFHNRILTVLELSLRG
jgi:hypothetical protein